MRALFGDEEGPLLDIEMVANRPSVTAQVSAPLVPGTHLAWLARRVLIFAAIMPAQPLHGDGRLRLGVAPVLIACRGRYAYCAGMGLTSS